MDHRIHQTSSHALQYQNRIQPKQAQPKSNFKDILATQNELKISKHASERLEQRNIKITEELWQTIGEKVQEAKQKGINDSLVVLDNAALLVSAKNNTVVTAMNRMEAQNRIFTNINGTILIDK